MDKKLIANEIDELQRAVQDLKRGVPEYVKKIEGNDRNSCDNFH